MTAALAVKTRWVREFHPVEDLVATPVTDREDWAYTAVRMPVHITITHAA